MHKQDSTQSIVHSAKRFFGGTMLSRISGLLRDVAMAFAFGTQEAVAAFLVAFRFAHLLRRLFGEGALQTAFIPQFETLRKEDPQRACYFFRDLVGLLSVGLTVLIVIAMFTISACLYFFDFSEGNREILLLTFLLMPSLLFICLFGINASLLQCEKSYFTPGVAPVAFNVVWIIGVLFLWQMPSALAMPRLAGWVIAACFCQWLITVPRVLVILRVHGIKELWQAIHFRSPHIKGFYKPLLLGLIGVAATQINSAVDAVFARYADSEGPALLWYALRIQQLPLALFGVAIAGALLPPLTRAIKANDQAAYQVFLEFTMRRSIALMLPITIALFVLGDSCINLIYGRGDFTDHSTIGTTQCLWAYASGLLPMTFVLILAPAFYAQGNPRIPATISVIAMALNIGLNAWLIGGLGLGASSVALATGVSAWVNFVLLAWALPHFKAIASRELWQSAFKIFCASMAGAVVVISVDGIFMQGSTAWIMIQGGVPEFPREFMSQLVRLGVQGTCFLLTFGFVAWVLKATDILRFTEIAEARGA